MLEIEREIQQKWEKDRTFEVDAPKVLRECVCIWCDL